MALVIAVGRESVIRRDVAFVELAPLDAGEDLLGRARQRQSQVIDHPQFAVGVELPVERHLRVGRAAPNERPAAVVADAADDRRADARRADHRVRLTAERLEQFLELVERRSGKAHDLPTVANEVDAAEPHGVDDDDAAVIIVAVRGRSAGQPGVRGLHDDALARREARLHRAPLLDERSRPDDCDHRARAEAISVAEAARRRLAGKQVGPADDPAQRRKQVAVRLRHQRASTSAFIVSIAPWKRPSRRVRSDAFFSGVIVSWS